MNVAIVPSGSVAAEGIGYVSADEAFALMETALGRLLGVLELLEPEEWGRPTACTAWDVRDMVAHQAGGYAGGTGYGEMVRQLVVRPKGGVGGALVEDRINALQLEERAGRSPGELMAELRVVGERAIYNWAYGFRLVKWVGMPHPVPGWLGMRHLMWVIHSRDTWMHRLDICRATGREFVQTGEHDGRINELVVRDLARSLQGKLDGRGFELVLTGLAGGRWLVGVDGCGRAGEAVIEMDVLDFNIYASGRFSYEEGRERAHFSGDVGLADLAFRKFSVLY